MELMSGHRRIESQELQELVSTQTTRILEEEPGTVA
jgi:hypothetical protein